MSYSKKTANYNLPQWEANDKPSMRDYNDAFTAVDSQLANKVNINDTVKFMAMSQALYDAPDTPYPYVGSVSRHASNLPVSGNDFHISYLTGGAGGYGTQIAMGVSNAVKNTMYMRTAVGLTWQPWKRLATAEPPQKNNLSFITGVSGRDGQSNYCIKTQEDIVIVVLDCVKTDGTAIPIGTSLATLPVGFRPSSGLYIPAALFGVTGGANVTSGLAYIGIDGSVTINKITGDTQDKRAASFKCTFVSA
ncbi:hypothetical protein U6B65_05630 [Oscillospiraceae bacterium MB08-C2-2]|nr:hypothetical protein U6B65_05630 [Oscillospiraceae bacterium MB08-C2-2]